MSENNVGVEALLAEILHELREMHATYLLVQKGRAKELKFPAVRIDNATGASLSAEVAQQARLGRIGAL